ncbi:MAG: hypothetical protein IPJ79_20175 [Bacteroidetes bacterium]|nr:hypothetical protein [Bacteroidota bacterium]
MMLCTKNNMVTLCLIACYACGFAQEPEGTFLKDKKTGCTVWLKHTFTEDSATWNGGCKNNFAEGYGTIVGFTKGNQTLKYVGEVIQGKPNGKGILTFGNNRKLEGNFLNGEPLFLNEVCLTHLHKNVVSETDSSGIYYGDNNKTQLYYHALVPGGQIAGVLVLMPGTWQTTEHLLSSTQALCELAYQNNLAVIVPSINQRITLTNEIVELLNTIFTHAIKTYHLPKHKFVMGGWSMGGIFSMRYTQMAKQDSLKTVVNPVAVFNCDGPCDLKNVYHNFKRKLNKNPGQNEPAYGIYELEKHCGGTPATATGKYSYYSPYSHSEEKGGNAQYLITVPVRIYADVDPEWWMQNRNVDMYDLNALDQTAMIQLLKDMGNSRAEFINAYQKGVRLEGNRHPHSWSIVEPHDCIRWMLGFIK